MLRVNRSPPFRDRGVHQKARGELLVEGTAEGDGRGVEDRALHADHCGHVAEHQSVGYPRVGIEPHSAGPGFPHTGRVARVEHDEPQAGEIGERVGQICSSDRIWASVLGIEKENPLFLVRRRAAMPHEVKYVALLIAERLAQSCQRGDHRDDMGRRTYGFLEVTELLGQFEGRQF